MDSEIVDKVNEVLEKSKQAAAIFSQSDQKHTDRIVRAVYQAALNNRVRLAKMAFEETEMGVFEHKVMKNVLASQFVYEDIKIKKPSGNL